MRVAFYKGKGNFFNGFIRFWDAGIYSHCELILSDGMSLSSSYQDKGVRAKKIGYNDGNWDFIEVPDHLERDAIEFFKKTNNKQYDLFGQVRFLIAPARGQKEKYWCSEWVAAALGMKDSWRYSPNSLFAALSSIL